MIARVHPSAGKGPALVHVDAYRLSSIAEVDDLDLDASLQDSVTVVEWGEDKVEGLSEDRLELRLVRRDGAAGAASDEAAADPRVLVVRPVGKRWESVDLDAVLAGS